MKNEIKRLKKNNSSTKLHLSLKLSAQQVEILPILHNLLINCL